MEGMEGAGSRRQDTFGLREIGLNLSTTTGDAQSMMYTADASVDTVMAPLGVHTGRDAAGSGIGKKLAAAKKKVTRYFPGKAPKWVRPDEADAAAVFRGAAAPKGFHDRDGRRDRGGRRARAAAEPVVLKRDFKDEARKPPAAAAFEDRAPRAKAPERRATERVKAAPVVLKREAPAAPAAPPADSSSESDAEGDAAPVVDAEAEDEAAAGRARVRAKLRARAAAQEAPPPPPADASSSGDDSDAAVPRRPAFAKAPAAPAAPASSSSGSDDDSSDDDDDSSSGSEAAARPVFVPRAMRGTIHEQEAQERKEAERAKAAKAKRKARAAESRALVADVVLRGEREAAESHFGAGDGHGSDFDAPDDDDDLEDPLEFEAWKVRELARATRERDERAKAAEDEAETERRRNLSPEERAAEDRESGKGVKKEKAKWKFLQKYHHKGAFYMDDDTLAKAGEGDVRNRDTDGAVLDDKFDKQALPKVMQVKDFGFQGRTKYTHLADQDTTFVDRDNPFNGWLQSRGKKDDPLRKKYESKMGGSKDIDASFRRRK